MAAPAGVSSEPAPDPDVPETAATGPQALEPADPEPSGPVGAEAAADPEPSGPVEAEAAADPEPGTPADERVREDRGISWLVTAGVVLVVLALAAAAGVLAVTTHGFRPKTVVTYRRAAVFGLRAGDCLNSSQNGLSVTILSCATPHEAEVSPRSG